MRQRCDDRGAWPGGVGGLVGGLLAYSPLVTTDGRVVLNATHVANDSGRHYAVTSIDLRPTSTLRRAPA